MSSLQSTSHSPKISTSHSPKSKNKKNTCNQNTLVISTSINGIKLQELFPTQGGTDTPIGNIK
jgi:hypothetical protein